MKRRLIEITEVYYIDGLPMDDLYTTVATLADNCSKRERDTLWYRVAQLEPGDSEIIKEHVVECKYKEIL